MTQIGVIQSLQRSATPASSINFMSGGSNGRPIIVRGWRNLLILFSLCMATAIASQAQTFRIVLSFNGTNGSEPNGPLVQGFDGNLYGTTAGGGSQDKGTVFKVTPPGTLTTIYSFCSQTNCADGGFPEAGLALGKDGNFYGTTSYGGAAGDGTIFKITPRGVLSTLHNFCSLTNCADGFGLYTPLMQARDGNFYGASPTGGIEGSHCFRLCGMVFKITPTGKFTIVYHFCSQTNCADGYSPNAVVQATDGKLYGTTAYSPNSYGNGGTVFRLSTAGALTTLYSFCAESNCTDGDSPRAALTQGSDGNLYGTTAYGLVNDTDAGTVFKITTSGVLTTFYGFCAQTTCSDGADPQSQLIQATDGNFYATTIYRGTLNGGTLYKLTPGGTLTVLHDFPSWRIDVPGVMQATDGNFYGEAQDGTKGYYGIIFKESTGLSPFVETLPTSGVVGAKVTILGTNLTGATTVSFNGTVATYTVVSSSEITTTVPTGATTGTVKVATPTKTLSSNMVFRVR